MYIYIQSNVLYNIIHYFVNKKGYPTISIFVNNVRKCLLASDFYANILLTNNFILCNGL